MSDIFSSYEDYESNDNGGDFDTTDLQGSGISESYKNNDSKEYDKDHESSWKRTIASIKLKLSGL